MITQKDIDALWYNSINVPGALYKLNDSVKIISGEHMGEYGAVISLIKLEPIPEYLVELGSSGSGILILEKDLIPID